jgi:hypothetical protein
MSRYLGTRALMSWCRGPSRRQGIETQAQRRKLLLHRRYPSPFGVDNLEPRDGMPLPVVEVEHPPVMNKMREDLSISDRAHRNQRVSSC